MADINNDAEDAEDADQCACGRRRLMCPKNIVMQSAAPGAMAIAPADAASKISVMGALPSLAARA